MKKIAIACMLISGVAMAGGGTIVLEGKYQNRNLYVQNGFAESGVGFCTFEVLINGEVTTDEIQSSAFEIDLSAYKLKMGDKVVVELRYKDGCGPKILNPEALKPKATFETVSINVDKEGILHWTTKGESGSLPFIIEQFRWNKWVQVGEVQGVGTADLNEYSFKVFSHSGENRFRVKQTGSGMLPKTSNVAVYKSTNKSLTYVSNGNQILFSDDTLYEMYDMYGNIIKRGFGKDISANNLPRGTYYINFDNQSIEFVKRSR